MYEVKLDCDGKVSTSYFKDIAPANMLYYNYVRYYALVNKYHSDDIDMDALFNIEKIFNPQPENTNLEIKIPCIGDENSYVYISLRELDLSEYIVGMKVSGEIQVRVFAPDEDTAKLEADKMLKYQNLNMMEFSSTEVVSVENVGHKSIF